MNETKNYSITKSGAVILEGGANRGVFTAGALDFLMEQEYYIPHVIGVSAGACNALDYVSRQIGRTRDCMIVTDEKNRYVNRISRQSLRKKHCSTWIWCSNGIRMRFFHLILIRILHRRRRVSWL